VELALLVMERSATGRTVVCMVLELLFKLGSSVLNELTKAELLIVPGLDGAVTTRVISGAEPTDKVSRLQKIETVPIQSHPSSDLLIRVVPGGILSETVSEEAELGPRLVTERV